MSLVSRDVKQEILDYCLQSMEHGLNFNTQGNISRHFPQQDLVAITPSDLEYDRMVADDVVVVDKNGEVVEGDLAPSSEVDVHLATYRRRPDVNAIVHTEPVFSNIFGAVGRPIDGVLVNMVIYTKGPVPIMPFQQSNCAKFGEEMCNVMGDLNAVIWGNHGLLTVGDTLREAYKTTVAVESAARVLHGALQIDASPTVLDYATLGLDSPL